jgi:hypothetical protein
MKVFGPLKVREKPDARDADYDDDARAFRGIDARA